MDDNRTDELQRVDATSPQKQTVRIERPRSFSLMPQTLGEAMELAKMIAYSDMAPKDYKEKTANVLIAIQMGADVGLKPMQALQNIAIINGRPSVWGDAALGLVQASGTLERFTETMEGVGDQRVATCRARRVAMPDDIVRTFSYVDAKKANLIGKAGPWTTYESRMMQMRARSWVLRDGFADILMGLSVAEEAMDIAPVSVTPVIDATVISDHGPFNRLPEAMRDRIEKAMAVLNLLPAQRLTKLNEYLGGEGVDLEAQGDALIQWCKDEYSKRKTGLPQKPKDENGKKTVETAAPATTTETTTVDQAPVETKAESAKETPATVGAPVTAAEIPFGKKSGEYF